MGVQGVEPGAVLDVVQEVQIVGTAQIVEVLQRDGVIGALLDDVEHAVNAGLDQSIHIVLVSLLNGIQGLLHHGTINLEDVAAGLHHLAPHEQRRGGIAGPGILGRQTKGRHLLECGKGIVDGADHDLFALVVVAKRLGILDLSFQNGIGLVQHGHVQQIFNGVEGRALHITVTAIESSV